MLCFLLAFVTLVVAWTSSHGFGSQKTNLKKLEKSKQLRRQMQE